ncbi:MAG TPA: hypothetical protein VN673_05885 [Clostridia bacterium]|nr:hypothetical protein [Clostridia bacterium]
MNRQLLTVLLLSALSLLSMLPGRAQTNAVSEKALCTKNLKAIYAAIQSYQNKHKDLPNWLSDLVPDYIEDINTLVCPVCRRTGRIEESLLADPKLPSSYLFEFCPVPLGNLAPKASDRTRREWKRRQMGLVGSSVPLVRCRHHYPVLNLAFDGNIYESPPAWEWAFTNRVSLTNLSAAMLFAEDPANPHTAQRFPPRDPKTRPAMLDLSRFYNVPLSEPIGGRADVSLASLPAGIRPFAGTDFDVRGLVVLASKSEATSRPQQVRGIPVHQKCKRLHFLHAASPGSPGDEGAQIASYFIKFVGNPARLEIPVQYGRDLRGYKAQATEPAPTRELAMVWSSTQPSPGLRLFRTTWTNLLPDTEIESIDFVSAMGGPAPFLIAITAD